MEQGENLKLWSRSDVSTCSCSQKSYRHVHCPCSGCNGRATDRSTELRHWRQAHVLFQAQQLPIDDNGCIDSETELSFHESDLSDGEQPASLDSETELDFHDSDLSEGEQPMETGNDGDMELEEDLCDSSDEPTAKPTNPMRKLVVTAVLDALKIKRDSGVSIGTFEDILQYAKKMLLASFDDKNIDRDILITLWPKTWNDVQSILKEEGFEDAKQYYICFCRQEKAVDPDSGASKYSYSGKYSIVENKEKLCSHCGNKCYLTFYYLGLNSKVKNWFRSKTLCEQMLSHWKERSHWLGKAESWPLKREIWDGQRWVDLQWFWDPDKTWPLPTLCPFCRIPVSADHLINSPNGSADGLRIVECPECLETFKHTMKFANGSPLNLAFIGHWDG